MQIQAQRITEPLQSITCKICASHCAIAGLADFSKCGLDHLAGYKATPYQGVPIYYYQCESCQFTFTNAFDDWLPADYEQHIYNSDYATHDPDYLDARPEKYANLLIL